MMKLQEVAIGLLQKNPWNPNVLTPEAELQVEQSIKRLGGLFKPVIVREIDGGRLEILGGEHRWEVAQKLGYKTIPIANVGPVSDQVAKEIGLADNYRYGDDDPLKMAALLKNLPGIEELSSFLPITSEDIGSIFAAEALAENMLDDIINPKEDEKAPEQRERATPTHQIMRFKVPVEDIAWVTALIERTMKAQGYTGSDSQENAGNALIHLMNRQRDGV